MSEFKKKEGDSYLSRLIIERDELEAKLIKLDEALTSKSGPATERDVLYAQGCAMKTYLNILEYRLNKPNPTYYE